MPKPKKRTRTRGVGPGGRQPYKQLRARLGDELFTPVDEELLGLLERLKNEWGGWMRLGEGARVSQRWLRYVRAGRHKTLGYTVVDEMLTNLGAVGEIQKLSWYSIEQLLELGLWEEQVTYGHKRPPIK